MNAYGYYAGFVADARPHMIVDRFHWSEEAYGAVYRGGSGFSKTERMKIELMSLAQDARVLYMTDGIESIRGRWDENEMYPSTQLEELSGIFEKEYEQSSLPTLRARLPDLIDGSGRPTEALARFANEAQRCADLAYLAPAPSIGAGRLRDAKFFVIGPTPTLSSAEKAADVQFPLPLGHAEEPFWESLSEVDGWKKGFYTSASSYSTAALKKLILTPVENRHDCPTVVCLGNEAAEAAEAALGKWPIVKLHHPSHALRDGSLDSWLPLFQGVVTGACL
jgi:hypothetical protein